MVRTKVKVNITVLKLRNESMNIIIGSGTTADNIVSKVLEKCRSKEPSSRFQLWATTSNKDKDQLLSSDNTLSHVISAGNHGAVQFHLRLKPHPPQPPPSSACLVRVYHQFDEGYETFQSLIVSPRMTSLNVKQLAVARISPNESPDQFDLLQKTPAGDRVLQDDDAPLLLASGDRTQLKLKRKSSGQASKFVSPSKRMQQVTGAKPIPLPAASLPAALTPPTAAPVSSLSFASDSDHQPSGTPAYDGPSESPGSISDIHFHKGKLQLHSELIRALRAFAPAMDDDSPSKFNDVLTREEVLEQAVVEQNQILDIMQSLISSLESESKSFREKIEVYSRTILELASWEARAKKAERKLENFSSTESKSELTVILSEYEKTVAERDQTIAKLNSKLSSLSQNQGLRHPNLVSTDTRLMSTKTKLETERVKVLELEEELSTNKQELSKLKKGLSEKQSILITKETEILHLHHKMKSTKNFQSEQQELMLRQRTALMDKDAQLTSLTRALAEEKKQSEQMRKKHLQLGMTSSFLNSKVADSNFTQQLPEPLSPLTPCLFEQVLSRDIIAVELTKLTADTQLGFSFTKMDLPVSSKVPCLIVKAVKQRSLTFGLIKPGDEILEINSISCRGPNQSKGTDLLDTGVGTLKIVLARDKDYPSFDSPVHSTPSKPNQRDGDSTLWATALSGDDTIYKSFTVTKSAMQPSKAVMVEKSESLSQSFALSTKGSSGPQGSQASSPSTSNEAIARAYHSKAGNDSSCEEDESASYKRLQMEFADLQDQFDESERLRLDIEVELDESRAEMTNIQMENDLTKAENFELNQQVEIYSDELSQIQGQITELQGALVYIQGQLTVEQQRTASYENQNRLLSNELDGVRKKLQMAQNEINVLRIETEKLREASLESEQLRNSDREKLEQMTAHRDNIQALVASKDNKIEEVSSSIGKIKSEFEATLSQVKKEKTDLLAELEKAHRMSKEITSSIEEQSKTQAQLESVKKFLMEAELKKNEVAVQMRYLKQAADEANRQISETMDKHTKLESDCRNYKEDLENLTLRNESLNLRLKQTQIKLEDKEEMLIRLQEEVDNLRRNMSKLTNEKSHFKQEASKLRVSVRGTESEQRRLEDKLRESTKEKDSLFQELEESIEESTQLQQKIEDMESMLVGLEALKDEKKKLEGQVQEVLNELTSAKQTATSEIEVLKMEKKLLEEELERKETKYQLSKDETKTVSSQIYEEKSHLQLELQKQRDSLAANEGERTRLSHECTLLKAKDIEQKATIDRLTQTNQNLGENLDSTKTASKETSRKLDACQKKFETVKQQSDKYKEDISDLEIASGSLQKQLDQVTSDNMSLTGLKEDQERETVNLQETVTALRAEMSLREMELTEAKSICSQLQEEIRLEKTHSEEKEVSLQTLITSLQSARKQNNDMVTSMEFLLKQEQAKTEDVQNSLTNKEEESNKLKEQLSDISGQLHAMRAERDSTVKKLIELKQKSKVSEDSTQQEISDIKGQLEECQSKLSQLQDDYKSMETVNSKHESSYAQLRTTVEHANRERYALQKSLDETLKERASFEDKSNLLDSQVSRLKSTISHLEETSNSLSSEGASFRQQLRQSEREIDRLSAQVQAAEINLEVANRTLDTEQKQGAKYIEAALHIQDQLKETQEKLEDARIKMQKGNLELHACEEQKSQLKSSLDLRHKECNDLQKSLIEAQSSAKSLKSEARALEAEKENVSLRVNQLQDREKEFKLSLQTMKKESSEQLEREQNESARRGREVIDLTNKESSHLDKIKKLEKSLIEARGDAEQFLAAQEALKQSLTALGSDKDIEILRLSNEISVSRSNLAAAQKELGDSESFTQELQVKMRESDCLYKSVEAQNIELKQENSRLTEEIDSLQATESELTELHSKISTLEENLHTKGVKLTQLTQRNAEMESELKSTQTDNDNYHIKVSELANIKLELVETASVVDQLKNQVAIESKNRTELESERDQLLTMLRKLEVEKHTAVVQQSTPQLRRNSKNEIDEKEIIRLLKDKEEEAFRLREYVGKLLTNVVEKAPFVLENMT